MLPGYYYHSHFCLSGAPPPSPNNPTPHPLLSSTTVHLCTSICPASTLQHNLAAPTPSISHHHHCLPPSLWPPKCTNPQPSQPPEPTSQSPIAFYCLLPEKHTSSLPFQQSLRRLPLRMWAPPLTPFPRPTCTLPALGHASRCASHSTFSSWAAHLSAPPLAMRLALISATEFPSAPFTPPSSLLLLLSLRSLPLSIVQSRRVPPSNQSRQHVAQNQPRTHGVTSFESAPPAPTTHPPVTQRGAALTMQLLHKCFKWKQNCTELRILTSPQTVTLFLF